jgi:DNA-binding MarR family transcriptional regulator
MGKVDVETLVRITYFLMENPTPSKKDLEKHLQLSRYKVDNITTFLEKQKIVTTVRTCYDVFVNVKDYDKLKGLYKAFSNTILNDTKKELNYKITDWYD